MAIQIRNWVLETEKRTNIQQTDRLLIGNAANGESLYTTVQDFANLMVGAGFINQGDWQTGTTYNPGDYVFAESVGGGGSSMYFLKGSSPYLSSIDPKDDLTHWSEFAGIPGPQGPKGDKGDTGAAFTYEDFTPEQLDALVGPAGDSGWSPLERTVVDNTNLDSEGQYRVVREIYDWTGGEGTKPTLTGYIGATGIVANIVNAENIRGSRGATGATGAKGDQGETGPMGEGLHFDAVGPIADRGDYDSEPAGFVYLADDEGKFYVRLDPTGWSVGQSIAGGLQTLSQPAVGQIAISSGNTINLNTVNTSGNQTGIAGNKTWTGVHTFSLLSGTGNGIVGVTSTGQLTRRPESDVIQTLSLGTAAGNIAISGGNSVSLNSVALNSVTALSFTDWFTSLNTGLYSFNSGGSTTGFPTATGSGIIVRRSPVSSGGAFSIYKAASNDFKLRFNVGTTDLNWNGWQIFASEEWVTSQNYITSASIGNGTLTLATGTGLTGSASFTANQSTPSTFTVGIASGYKLPTTTEWGNLVELGDLAPVATTGDYDDLTNKPTLGTASALNVGTSANNVVQLDSGGKLPAVDGSQLTNLPSSDTMYSGIVDIGATINYTPVSTDNNKLIYSSLNSTGGASISLTNFASLPTGFAFEYVIAAAGTPGDYNFTNIPSGVTANKLIAGDAVFKVKVVKISSSLIVMF